jgi:tetratricopeptide (TPR) repeat protein
VSAAQTPASNRFSALLLEGLDHYRKGKMLEAVRAWEEAYQLEPTNVRAREFLKSALERIHAHMGGAGAPPGGGQKHPWLPSKPGPLPVPAGVKLPTAADLPPPQARPPPPATPWDDGPSLALPQQPDAASEDKSGAWKIHEEPLPAAPAQDPELTAWMQGANELIALNDFSGALELLGKVLARKPNDPEALKHAAVCEENLTQMYESKMGAMDRIPKVVLPPDEIIWLNLDPRAGFVLAQIDGAVSFEDLYAICGLRRLDTARILSQLLDEGVIGVEGEAAVGKRALPRQHR